MKNAEMMYDIDTSVRQKHSMINFSELTNMDCYYYTTSRIHLDLFCIHSECVMEERRNSIHT